MWGIKKSNVYKMKLGKQIKTQLHFSVKKNTAPPPPKEQRMKFSIQEIMLEISSSCS